jgi:hypothetical protein
MEDEVSQIPTKKITSKATRRYSLNYKGIQYDTVWLEYPEIEGFSKQVGVSPTKYKPDGRPTYTLPMIHDPTTGKLSSLYFHPIQVLPR